MDSIFSKGFLNLGEITMSSLNQVMLLGNLGKDPEVLKSTDIGSFVRLSLATSKKFKSKTGEVQEDIQWHTVYLNNNLGKLAATHLKKGAKIFVSGELRTRNWQDKNDVMHRVTAVYAKEIKFLSNKSQKGDPMSDQVEEDGAYITAMQEIRKALNPASETK
jgi:single-strand DNA-binding protein